MTIAMPGKNVFVLIGLVLAAAIIFLAECAVFHFPFATGLDALWLVGLTLLPGTLVVLIARQIFSLELAAHEILSLGSAVGFGIPPLLLGLLHALGMTHAETAYYIIRIAITVTVLVLLVMRKLRLGFSGQLRAINDVWIFAIGILLLLGTYHLVQFHYAANGAIVTHSLFAVDLPFLAGEIHGIQDFGSLRDLHQMAQPWHYHDWSYQLLALLPRARTLPDLALASPLVSYTLLALSVFMVVQRFTKNTYLAYISTALWFLVSGLGQELESYAMSPSFVFGSIVVLNALLVIELRMKADLRQAQGRRERWVFLGLLLGLLLELSQTKLSSFLVLIGAIGLLAILLISNRKIRGGDNAGWELLVTVLVGFGIVAVQNFGANPYMPAGDFLVGAPLLGYANHLAKILHVPVTALNPVSVGPHLQWRSLFIVPYFVFHMLRIAFTDPKILSAIIFLAIFRKALWQDAREVVSLLVIVLPFGLLLPVLYSPAWYPLALSFYAPLVSVQAALLLVAIGFGTYAHEVARGERTRVKSTAAAIVALLFVFGVATEAHAIWEEDLSKPDVVPASLIRAMTFVSMHSEDTGVIATRRFDLDSAHDESYYWYSALSGRSVISEGAKYGSLLAAVADTNSEKGLHPVPSAQQLLLARRELLDTIYTSRDSANVNAAIVRSGVVFILEDVLDGPALSKPYLSHVAIPVFSDEKDTIWKVR